MTLREILDIHPEWADMELVVYGARLEKYYPVDEQCFFELTEGRLAI